MERCMFCFLLGVSFGPFSMMTGFVPGASNVHRPPIVFYETSEHLVFGLPRSLLPILGSHVGPFGLQVSPISTHTAASLMLAFLCLRCFRILSFAVTRQNLLSIFRLQTSTLFFSLLAGTTSGLHRLGKAARSIPGTIFCCRRLKFFR
jgi:hypothetical protein